jgi:alkylation response protein AidB-like acyl-CoA dehydrogenase
LNKGFAYLINKLPIEQLILAVGAIAPCSGMLDMMIEYTKQRQLFGRSLSQLQNTRFVLSQFDSQMIIHKAFILHCIALYEEDGLSAVMASKAKLSSTELQCKVADDCLQLFGGYGYMEEYPIARAFLDARVQRIYGGASEVMKEIIARDLLGK